MIRVNSSWGIGRAHRHTHVDTIYNLDVIKINESLRECEFCLGSWLLETLSCDATAFPIISAICFGALLAFHTASSTSHSTTPYNIKAVVIYRYLNIFLGSLIKHVISISRLWIHKEALSYVASLYALASLEAVAITPALCILTPTRSH